MSVGLGQESGGGISGGDGAGAESGDDVPSACACGPQPEGLGSEDRLREPVGDRVSLRMLQRPILLPLTTTQCISTSLRARCRPFRLSCASSSGAFATRPPEVFDLP